MLNKIVKSNDWRETVKSIFDLFYDNCVKERIPALIDLGSIFDKNSDYEELYVKLVLVPNGEKIQKTWIKDNLSPSSTNVFGDEFDSRCHNLVVQFNYNGVQKYGFNSILLSSDDMIYVDFNDGEVIHQAYNAYDRIKKPRILQKENTSEKILTVSFLALEDLLNEGYDGSFDLYADFEFRKYTDNYQGEVGEFEELDGRYYITYDSNTPVLREENKAPLLWIQGSKKLDSVRLKQCLNEETDIALSVISLDTQKIRPHNPKNYNDDINAGLVPFSYDCIDLLKQYYLVYGLLLIPKRDDIPQVMIDFVDDYIVFWEGEYNKLPLEIKNELINYNIKKEISPFLSEAMFAWQLGCCFDYSEKEAFYQQLADYYREHHLQESIEKELSFDEPKTVCELGKFISKALAVVNLSLEDLRFVQDKHIMFEKICNNDINLDKQKISDAYEGFCYILLRCLNDKR